MSSIKEITLDDLAADESFFKDLREGKYVLVLGAGFSYGLPGKSGHSIPIVTQFVELTNQKFGTTFNAVDYNAAADKWQRYIQEKGCTEEEEKRRFEEFKNLFVIDEALFKAQKKLYTNILIPSWNHIYTFNFDNVLDSLVKNKIQDYEFQYLESGSFSPARKTGIGYLHNSILKASSISDLVFTNNQYAKKIQKKSQDNHLYYALFNDIKTHKKNLVIIGCQFNEQTVYSYLLDEERGIRDDLKIININYGAQPNYGLDVEELLHDSNWVNCTATDFLQFLQYHKHKIQNIVLDGALTINQGFVDKIKKGAKFSKSKFYSSKQDDNCQWYGILNGFDIERLSYQKIKKEVAHAFDQTLVSKVTAVVHGTGGCGKSTLLRRLALELCQETDYQIIWVKDRQLENFVNNSLSEIRADEDNQYLVFVEDWYRLTDQQEEVGNELLKMSQSIQNIRLVIGDRKISGKDYLDNLTNRENTFELTERENKYIIEKIIAKHPVLEPAAKLVLKNLITPLYS